MASSAKACFLLFLLTILTSQKILARESQFFNKVSGNNHDAVTGVEPNKQQPLNKPEEEPNFIPENENTGYGLYGHESGQLPPSTTTTTTNGEPYKTTTNGNIPYNTEVKDSFPNSKYLPKNYNTEAYVTEPEGYNPTTTPENNNNYSPFSIPNSKYLPKNYNTESYVTEPEGYTAPHEYNKNYNGENGYYNSQHGYTGTANGNNYYGNQQQGYTNSANGNNYNSFAQSGYTTTGGNNYNHYNGANSNGYEKQGMSDTRFLENGKYFYDVNFEKSNFNPNENTRTFGYSNEYNSHNNRGYYSNNMNSYQNNNNGMDGFSNQEQFQNFQDEEDLP